MYVSRIGKKRSEDTEQTDRSGSHISYRIEKTSQTVKKMEYLYRFGKFEHMLSACRVLNAMNFDGRSQAYSERTDGSGAWCLIIKGEAKWSLTLSEYGEAMKSRYDKWRIFEQYTEVCGDNAAEILGNL